MSRAHLVQALLPIFALTTFAACSSAETGAPQEATGTSQQKVIKGVSSDATQDAVVLLAYYDPASHGFGACTGTLIAPNLVLTARHCVADTDQGAACAKDGSVLAGGVVRKTHRADSLYVFTGKDRPNFYTGKVTEAGRGAKIIDDGATNLCNHDIALVVLKEPVANAKIAQIRLDGEVAPGEVVTVVGWGVTDKTPEPQTRQQRTGVKIQEVGPADSFPAVSPNEFQVGESICSGDSGGPALDEETKAIVGVVSRGGNLSGPGNGSDPAANCIAGNNLYTKVSPFKDLILNAFEQAGAEPWIEGGPDPRLAKPNVACTEAAECRSNLCLADPSQKGVTTCAQTCEADADCTDGQKCVASSGSKVCRSPEPPKPPEKKGCATAPGSTGSGAGLWLAVGLLGLAFVRRRR